MKDFDAIKGRVAEQLARAETMHRDIDDRENQIAEVAEQMLAKLNEELNKRAETLGPDSPEDEQREYIRLLGEKAVAERVLALAEENLPREMRGGGPGPEEPQEEGEPEQEPVEGEPQAEEEPGGGDTGDTPQEHPMPDMRDGGGEGGG